MYTGRGESAAKILPLVGTVIFPDQREGHRKGTQVTK